MDGCDVARRLRGEPGTADVLLVAVTGWGQDSDREMSRAAGFDHHLVKPVQLEVLRGLLATAVPAGSRGVGRASTGGASPRRPARSPRPAAHQTA
jgi:CheY-like chemotaxis protein